MISTNLHIKFGYGTVAVGSNYIELTFQNIRPPQKVGKNLCDVPADQIEFYGQIYSTQMKFNDCKELRKYLDIVEESKGGSFNFHGFHFDFEKYNIESLNAIRRNIKYIESMYLMAMAC